MSERPGVGGAEPTQETIIPQSADGTRSRGGWLTNFARKLVFQQLAALSEGEITVIEGDKTHRFGRPGGLRATITVRDSALYGDTAFGGGVGAAESYIRGRWSCDDLTQLCRIFARNIEVMDGMERGWAWLKAPLAKGFHCLHRNTRAGSGKNIQAHYDLGNDLFRLFLDETMNYSCGVFETPEATMAEASILKMDRICRKLELKGTDHLLEIGTGWGAMAMHAAGEYGCRVTTTTISREQYALAVEVIQNAGLDDRITVLLSDYRDLTGEYDKAVSVEMIEAVGHEFLPAYFGKLGELLKPDGLFLVQGITMPDHRYDSYRKSVDFIQRFVFPGSCLTSVSAMSEAAKTNSDLRPAHLDDMTPHYAETLRRWRAEFFAKIDQVRALGYPESFVRLWEYYLCYCEAGFDEGLCGDVQMLFAKPRARRDTVLDEPVRFREAGAA